MPQSPVFTLSISAEGRTEACGLVLRFHGFTAYQCVRADVGSLNQHPSNNHSLWVTAPASLFVNSPYSRCPPSLCACIEWWEKKWVTWSLGGKDFQNGVWRRQVDEQNVNRAIFWVESGSVEDIFEKKEELSYRGEKYELAEKAYFAWKLKLEEAKTTWEEEDDVSRMRREKLIMECGITLPFPGSIQEGWEERSLNFPDVMEDEVEAYMQPSTKAMKQGKSFLNSDMHTMFNFTTSVQIWNTVLFLYYILKFGVRSTFN